MSKFIEFIELIHCYKHQWRVIEQKMESKTDSVRNIHQTIYRLSHPLAHVLIFNKFNPLTHLVLNYLYLCIDFF